MSIVLGLLFNALSLLFFCLILYRSSEHLTRKTPAGGSIQKIGLGFFCVYFFLSSTGPRIFEFVVSSSILISCSS